MTETVLRQGLRFNRSVRRLAHLPSGASLYQAGIACGAVFSPVTNNLFSALTLSPIIATGVNPLDRKTAAAHLI